MVCEPFTQWVLEDPSPPGRPPLEDVGVQMVDDVEPYELMKLRLLNASHQALCYLGYLAGYRYAHEVCQDPLFADFLLAYMDREATPTLRAGARYRPGRLQPQLIERFANPEVRDTLARLCAESSDRIPKWLLPVSATTCATGGEIERSALVVAAGRGTPRASTSRASRSRSSTGSRTAVMAAAARQRDDPLAFIARPGAVRRPGRRRAVRRSLHRGAGLAARRGARADTRTAGGQGRLGP